MFPSMMVSSMMVVSCGLTRLLSGTTTREAPEERRPVCAAAENTEGRRILLVKTKPRRQQRVQFSKSFFDSLSGGGVFWCKNTTATVKAYDDDEGAGYETFSLKKTSTDDEDDDEYTVIDPLSPSFLGSFPNEWQNNNEKLRLVFALKGCSRNDDVVARTDTGVRERAGFVDESFVSEQKKQNRLENFLNDFCREGCVGHGSGSEGGRCPWTALVEAPKQKRADRSTKRKLANMRGENAAG